MLTQYAEEAMNNGTRRMIDKNIGILIDIKTIKLPKLVTMFLTRVPRFPETAD